MLAVLLAAVANVVHITADDIYYRGVLIAHTDPRSMCEDCRYVDSLLELLTRERKGSVVRIEVDGFVKSDVIYAVLLTVALASDDALVHYNIFAK